MDSFSSERNEKPTSRRLKKGREEGQRAYSPKCAGALALLGSVAVTALFLRWIIPLLKESFFIGSLEEIPNFVLSLAKMMIPLLVLIIGITFITHGWQSFFFFSFNLYQKKNKKRPHRVYSLCYTVISWIFVALLLFQ